MLILHRAWVRILAQLGILGFMFSHPVFSPVSFVHEQRGWFLHPTAHAFDLQFLEKSKKDLAWEKA